MLIHISSIHISSIHTGTYQFHSTSVVTDDFDPEWKDESYLFNINDLHRPGELSLMLYDHDIITQDDLVGTW